MKLKTWHYFAIGGGLLLVYLVLTKKSIITGKSSAGSSSWGSTLTGVGAAATGASNLLDSFKDLWGDGSASEDASAE
jgi:hypothetical protein